MTLESDNPTEPAVTPSVGAAVLQRNLEAHLFGAADPVQLGRFVVLETLGKGGMGSVYAAYDPDLDRRVAIKVLHTLGSRSEQGIQRLQREAKVLARLSHPSVIRVHEVGLHEDRLFIAMEFAPGGTLASWAETLEGPGRIDAIVGRIRECIAGLQAAHDAGLVHRDFKPANVLIGADGRAKVADFGLAMVDELPPDAVDPHAPVDEERITNTAQLVGTPAYMAPEQLEGHADAKSDQFSLCVTFFELLYGARPFPGDTIASLAASIHDDEIDWPRDRSPSWARPILERGLHHDPARRFGSLRALDEAIRQATRPRPRLGRALAMMGIAGGVVVSAWPSADEAGAASVGEPCTDGSETLAGVWDETSRAEIRSAFEATGQPAWQGLWERVEGRFDRFSADWRAMTLDSCEATRVHRTQDEHTHELRELCLARQREQARRLSESYLEVDGAAVYDTTRTSLELPRVADCGSRDALTFAGGRLDLSAAPVQEFFRLSDEASLASVRHRNGVAELLFREAALVAQEADIPKLSSRATRGVSLMLTRGGEHQEAEALAEHALAEAERAGDPDEIVAAWHRLGHAANAAGRTDDAQFYLERALTTADGFEATAEVRLAVVATAAHVLHRKGDPARAARMLLDAAAEYERLGLRPGRALAYLQDAIGPFSLAGEQEEALRIGRRAIELSTELRGAKHPNTLAAELALAQQYLVIGKPDQALPLTTHIVENLFPVGTLQAQRIDILATHGDILHENGRTEEGLAVLERTIAEAEQTLGPSAVTTLDARGNYAKVAGEAGNYEESIAALDQIVAGYAATEGVMLIRKAGALLNRSEAKSKLGRHAAAVEDLEAALPMLEESTAPDSAWRFDGDLMAGEIFAAAGLNERALVHFEAAEAIASKTQVSPEGLAKLQAHLRELRPNSGAPAKRDRTVGASPGTR